MKVFQSCVILGALIGFVLAADEMVEKAGTHICPLQAGPSWSPPSACVDACKLLKKQACCCKECGTDSRGNCDCHCCPSNVQCDNNLNVPSDGCTVATKSSSVYTPLI